MIVTFVTYTDHGPPRQVDPDEDAPDNPDFVVDVDHADGAWAGSAFEVTATSPTFIGLFAVFTDTIAAAAGVERGSFTITWRMTPRCLQAVGRESRDRLMAATTAMAHFDSPHDVDRPPRSAGAPWGENPGREGAGC